MDRAKFYAYLRSKQSTAFGTSLSQKQVDGLEILLDEGQKRGMPLRQLAYVLATAYHETAHTMQPVREMGGEKYLKSKKYYPYVGMGYVQLTWLENYQKASKALGVDFVSNPTLLLKPDYATPILFTGMVEGWFAGDSQGRHTLARHISGDKADYVNARRIINGVDKRDLIAGYAKSFEAALRAGQYLAVAPQPLPQPPVSKPEPVPAPSQPKAPEPAPTALPESAMGFWAWLISLFTRKEA